METTQIIKYEGDNSTFIWKHPTEDFNTTTQLIVHESQEAIFFMNGQALDLFGAGRYTLETQNIPVLSKFANLPTGGQTPFHCEVYFINLTEQMAIRWGTDSRVTYIEPTYNFPISIGASGEMTLSVADSRKLLVKLVGTEKELSQSKLITFFRAFLMTKIKTYIAQTMKTGNINIFELDEQLETFSNALKDKLINDFLDYGLHLNKFLVTNIVRPDGDRQYEKIKELFFRKYADVQEAQLKQQITLIDEDTEAKRLSIEAKAQANKTVIEAEGNKEKTIKEAQGLAEKRKLEGFTYQQERAYDVAQDIAQNESAGTEFTKMGIGLATMAGVGGALGGTLGNIVGGAMSGINNNTEPNNGGFTNKFCDQCGAELTVGAKFCDECGTPISANSCSNCGFTFTKPGKFCPNCGTKR